MQINLTDVLTFGKSLRINQDMSFGKIEIGCIQYELKDRVNIELEITKISSTEALLEGYIETVIIIPCDRCSDNVDYHLKVNFSKNVEILNDLDNDYYLDGYNLNIEEFVLNEIYINFPMKILCRDDCNGICTQCGINLNEYSCKCEEDNIDPRLAGLKDLFNKEFKEV